MLTSAVLAESGLSHHRAVETLRHFVRHGSGPMPAFTEAMVDNASLDEIATYLAARHKEVAQ